MLWVPTSISCTDEGPLSGLIWHDSFQARSREEGGTSSQSQYESRTATDTSSAAPEHPGTVICLRLSLHLLTNSIWGNIMSRYSQRLQWREEDEQNRFVSPRDRTSALEPQNRAIRRCCVFPEVLFLFSRRRIVPDGLGQHSGARAELLQQRRGSHGGHPELAGDRCQHGSTRGLWGLTLVNVAGAQRHTAPLTHSCALFLPVTETLGILLIIMWSTALALHSGSHWIVPKAIARLILGSHKVYRKYFASCDYPVDALHPQSFHYLRARVDTMSSSVTPQHHHWGSNLDSPWQNDPSDCSTALLPLMSDQVCLSKRGRLLLEKLLCPLTLAKTLVPSDDFHVLLNMAWLFHF